MADTFDIPFDVGSAQDYMGQVGGFNIGQQPVQVPDVSTAVPEYTQTAVQYAPETTFQTPSYTPTFAAYDPTFAFQPTVTPQTLTPDRVPFGQFASISGGAGGYVPNKYTTPAGPATTSADLLAQAAQYGRTGAVGPTGEPAPTGDQTQPQGKGILDQLLGKMSGTNLTQLLLGGAGGLMSYLGAQKAQQQAADAAAQYSAAANTAASQYQQLATPLLTAGAPQLSMALQGNLGPAQLQQYEAQLARLAQAGARTGGVGAIQTVSAEQRLYNDALQTQQTMALQLLGQADPIFSTAIATELQGVQGALDFETKYGAQAATALGQMMASLAGGIGRTG